MNNFAEHNPHLRFLTKGLFWVILFLILSLLCVFGVLSQMPGWKLSGQTSATPASPQGVLNSSPTTTATVQISSTPAPASSTPASSLPTNTQLAASSPTNLPVYGFVNLPAATATKKHSTTQSSSTPVIVTNTPVTPVESAPAVIGSSPANGATGVALASNIYVNFNEAVTAPSAAVFSLECPSGSPMGFSFSGSGSTVFTIVPAGNLPVGATCTVTVSAWQVSDVDLIDPPDSPATDYSFTFQTVMDTAPTVVQSAILPPATSGGPNTANLNAPVSTTTPTITVVFSEPVDLSTGAFALACPDAIGVNVSPALPASNQTSFNISPSITLTDGSNCTLTVVAANVSDTDLDDPLNQMVSNYTINFSINTIPSELLTQTEVGNVFWDVTGTGANNVDLDSRIVIIFSEPVHVIFPADGLQCPAGNNIPVVVTGNWSNVIMLDPQIDFSVNSTCILNIPAANISDMLSNHPTSDVSHTFRVLGDDGPTVVSNPAHGASGIATNTNITVAFNEPVTLTGNWFDLSCTTSGMRMSTSELSGTGVTIIENTPDLVYTLVPTTNLSAGESCTIMIHSANAIDNDPLDPPDQLDGDANSDFVDGDADDYMATFTVAP